VPTPSPVRVSILQRLTLWNSSVLAFALCIFAGAAWLTLTEVLQNRSISSVRESARAVAGAIRAGQQAIVERGEVEKERGDTEQAVLRELRAGDLDIFIADEADQVMAARQPRQERAGAITEIREGEREVAPVIIPASVRALMDEMRAAAQRGDVSDTTVLVRALQLGNEPARGAIVRLPPFSAAMIGEPTLLVVAVRPESEDAVLLRQVRNTLLLAIPIVLLASLVAGFALARRSLAPLEAINARTALITAANLEERLPVLNPHDELGRLARIINDLLARVGLAFSTQRQFVADASHELRTPIAIIRGEADVTLRRDTRTEPEYREALTIIRDESIHLTKIVDDLFLLARVDAGRSAAARRMVAFDELVQDAMRSVRSLADARQVSLTAQADDAAVTVAGDEALLRRLLLNLLVNALKHAPAHSAVRVSLSTVVDGRERVAVLHVADDGPGVPLDLRSRLFQRFVHGDDSAESRARSGAGLGLAIAEAITHAHGGRIRLLDTPHGATFEVRLPLPAPGASET
jgi:signal transduction histidine kinase